MCCDRNFFEKELGPGLNFFSSDPGGYMNQLMMADGITFA